jgi:hypothetical protein
LYADDTVLFLKPDVVDINLVIDLLSLFGKASGLHTNLQKSSVVPIWCDDQIIAAAKELLHCEFADFLCKYLRLPLSIKKLTRAQIQSIIDRVASSLPGWMAELITQGWASSARTICNGCQSHIYCHCCGFTFVGCQGHKKIMRGFLWKGRKEAKGVTTC